MVHNHIRSSFKNILLSSIGLILALGLIGSSLIYIDTMNEQFFLTDIQHLNVPYFSPLYMQIGIPFDKQPSFVNYGKLSQHLDNVVETNALTFGLQHNIIVTPTQTSIYSFYVPMIYSTTIITNDTYTGSQIETHQTAAIYQMPFSLNSSLIPYLSPGSRLPVAPTEALLVSTLPVTNLSVNQTLNLYDTYSFEGIQHSSTNLTLSGYTTTSANQIDIHEFLDKFSLDSENPSPFYLLVGNFTSFLQNMHFRTKNFDIMVNSRLYYDFNSLHARDAARLADAAQYFEITTNTNVSLLLQESGIVYNSFSIVNTVTGSMRNALDAGYNSSFPLFINTLPFLVVAVFVANYSFGLLNRQEIQKFKLYKQYGSSFWVVLVVQVSELVVIVGISSIGGLLSSIPLAFVGVNSTGVFTFGTSINSKLQVDIIKDLAFILIMGIIPILLISFPRILKFTRLSILEEESMQELPEPFWKRHYYDIFITASCSGGFLILYFAIDILHINLSPFDLLLFPLLVCIGIGTIFILIRMIVVVFVWLSKITWKKRTRFLALSIKHALSMEKSFTRGTILVSFLLAFIIVFITLPVSEANWTYESNALQIGADGTITFPHNAVYNASFITELKTHYGNKLVAISPFINVYLDSIQSSGHILALNASEAADYLYHGIDLGTQHILTDDLQVLSNSSPSFTNLLINQQNLHYYNLKLGAGITFFDLNHFSNITFKVIDSFTWWPGFVYSHNQFEEFQFNGIMDINYILNHVLNATYTPLQVSYSGIYIKFASSMSDTNKITLSKELEAKYSVSVTTIAEMNTNYDTSIQVIALRGQVNVIVATITVLILGIMSMFLGSYYFELKNTIFIEQALGLPRNKNWRIYFYSSILFLFTALFIGITIGGILTIFWSLFLKSSAIPHYVVFFPVEVLVIINSALFIFIILSSAFLVWKLTTLDIGTSLEAE